MKKPLRNILLLLALVFLSACYEDNSCSQNTVTGINVEVSNSGSDATTDLDSLDQSKVDAWFFTALDDTFVTSANQTYTSGIPLDMNDTSITVLFQIKDTEMTDYLQDTIVINYHQTDLRLLTVNCGFAPIYVISGGTHTLNVLDSVIMYDAEISTDLQITNVSFYY